MWKSVSRKRKCAVCGKPDWCSYNDKVGFGICRRLKIGSAVERQDANGVAYYVYKMCQEPTGGFNV